MCTDSDSFFLRDNYKANVVLILVCIEFKWPLEEVKVLFTARKNAFPRQVSMYVLHVCLGFCLSRLSTIFNRSISTVSYSCHLIENKRDDVVFDLRVSHIERCVSVIFSNQEIASGEAV